jgi:hypothetical protein
MSALTIDLVTSEPQFIHGDFFPGFCPYHSLLTKE